MGKFLVRKTNTGFKFDLKSKNGQVVGTSQVYASRSTCLKGIDSVRTNAPGAKLENQTEKDYDPETNPKFEMYADKSGEFRFRLKARNGQTIITSEGYSAKPSCLNGIESVRKNAVEAVIEEE